MKLLSPVSDVPIDENILQTKLERIHVQPFRQIIHVLFAGPCGLRDAVSAECAGYRLVRIHSVPIDLDVRNAVRPGRRQASPDADRGTLFRIGACIPVNRNFTSDECPVAFHAALDSNNGSMPSTRRNESLLPVELDSNRTAFRVIGESDSNTLDFQSPFGAEAPTLIGIDVANLLGR